MYNYNDFWFNYKNRGVVTSIRINCNCHAGFYMIFFLFTYVKTRNDRIKRDKKLNDSHQLRIEYILLQMEVFATRILEEIIFKIIAIARSGWRVVSISYICILCVCLHIEWNKPVMASSPSLVWCAYAQYYNARAKKNYYLYLHLKSLQMQRWTRLFTFFVNDALICGWMT